jgi:hypothetical protein
MMLHSAFREAGHKVFALHSAQDVSGELMCDCGRSDCGAVFKHPLASNWQHTPIWSDEQWEAICDYQITTGYGVLCTGLLVVDVDARNGGLESLEAIIEAFPTIAAAGLVVDTGSADGSRHYYFTVDDALALVSHLPEYPGIDFKSSGYVVGPGSLHRSGSRYVTALGSPDDIDAAPADLINALRKPDRHRAEYDGRTIDVSHGDIAEMLAAVDPDCDYETWIRCGMAIHDATGGTGFAVWDDYFAKNSSKYVDGVSQYKWHSFGRSANPVRVGTLIHYAEAGGWRMPVSFTPDREFDFPADTPRATTGNSDERRDGLPFDIAGIDLKSPPGFVGDVARWIEDQSRRPRENLAVAGALSAVGNVAGLRYTDDKDGVTTNLFAFCVAGSRTGKEAIQQAVATIHRAAGMAGATHGAIKSEQEIVRNLTRHQAALYVIDEIGIFLQKIKNAQTKGGALYLDGVIGMLMAAYSKADGFMLLTGDAKEDLRAAMTRELSQLRKKIEEAEHGPYVKGRADALETALGNLDKGLERPFLSLIGFTTPVTFDELVDFHSATNGFIGRALIFNERDTAPRSKRRFRKKPMTPQMEAAFVQLYSGGEYDMTADGRVEYYGNRREVPTSSEALDMLEAANDWFEDEAERHKSASGLEALYLGAYEIVSKVSLILAVPEGRRTAEHVRWAFALTRRDVNDKARLVTANDRQKDSPVMALQARLLNLIGGDGMTIGVIFNRCRSHKRTDVEKALAKLVENGLAFKDEEKSKGNGKPAVRYTATEGG